MALKLHNSIPKDPYTKQLWGEGGRLAIGCVSNISYENGDELKEGDMRIGSAA